MGQSWGWGCTWALAGQGPCAAAAQGRCLPAAGHTQSSRITGGCQGVSKSWPHRSQKSPHTPPWCWVNSQPRAHSAPCGSRMPVTLSSYSHREPLEAHQVAVQGCARACFGSPGSSPGEARSREVCSHQYHIQTTVLTAPSHTFTPCPSTGPFQR